MIINVTFDSSVGSAPAGFIATVNAVSPGVVPTPGFSALGMTEQQLDQYLKDAVSRVPLGKDYRSMINSLWFSPKTTCSI